MARKKSACLGTVVLGASGGSRARDEHQAAWLMGGESWDGCRAIPSFNQRRWAGASRPDGGGSERQSLVCVRRCAIPPLGFLCAVEATELTLTLTLTSTLGPPGCTRLQPLHLCRCRMLDLRPSSQRSRDGGGEVVDKVPFVFRVMYVQVCAGRGAAAGKRAAQTLDLAGPCAGPLPEPSAAASRQQATTGPPSAALLGLCSTQSAPL
jgi:hypothetical protein